MENYHHYHYILSAMVHFSIFELLFWLSSPEDSNNSIRS